MASQDDNSLCQIPPSRLDHAIFFADNLCGTLPSRVLVMAAFRSVPWHHEHADAQHRTSAQRLTAIRPG
jgi:hypothetical protein